MPRDAHVKPLFVCSRTTHAALWMSPELTPSPRCRTAGWRTLTFPAVPRVSRLLAPGVIDGPINSVAWLAYVQQSAYQRCTWVTSSSSTISAVTKARQPGGGLSRSARGWSAPCGSSGDGEGRRLPRRSPRSTAWSRRVIEGWTVAQSLLRKPVVEKRRYLGASTREIGRQIQDGDRLRDLRGAMP